jgi:hypothetical protein
MGSTLGRTGAKFEQLVVYNLDASTPLILNVAV